MRTTEFNSKILCDSTRLVDSKRQWLIEEEHQSATTVAESFWWFPLDLILISSHIYLDWNALKCNGGLSRCERYVSQCDRSIHSEWPWQALVHVLFCAATQAFELLSHLEDRKRCEKISSSLLEVACYPDNKSILLVGKDLPYLWDMENCNREIPVRCLQKVYVMDCATKLWSKQLIWSDMNDRVNKRTGRNVWRPYSGFWM